MKISFGRSESWSDWRGKHTVIDIRHGTGAAPLCRVIGTITGESGRAIPYKVECEGIPTFDCCSLKEAKARVIAAWQNRRKG